MTTKNYDIFKFSKNNRQVTTAHVKTLKESIKKYGYFNSKPITVTPDMVISDGQHRYLACKELGLPIVYEIDNISSDDSMVVLNTTSNIWRLNEFINHYASRGIECYIGLQEFMKQYHFLNVSCAISVYIGSADSGTTTNMIKSGKTFKALDKRNEIIELILFFKDKLKFHDSVKFVRALVVFMCDKKTEKKHIERLKKNTFSIIECARIEQYITMFNKLSKKQTT